MMFAVVGGHPPGGPGPRHRQSPPRHLATLVERFDPACFEVPPGRWVVRVESGAGAHDVELRDGRPVILPSMTATTVHCTISAPETTWRQIASDVRAGMDAFNRRRLRLRGNLRLALGFLAATSGDVGTARLRVLDVDTEVGSLATLQAGSGEPVVMVHGLGGTGAEFIPTITSLAAEYSVVAMDLPGFGDSTKPVGAPYDARFFARSVMALADALGLERFHLLGHSLGGRVALEVGIRHPQRIASVSLFTPSMAWLRERPWAEVLRLVRPELGALQPAPRPVVDWVVRRLVGSGAPLWVDAGIDEFLRSYCSWRGRIALYAAARNIYLEDPDGPDGMWTRLPGLQPPALFVWGSRDKLVPLGFRRHVERALPRAEHLVVESGHLPHLEQPVPTHRALLDFLHTHPSAPQEGRRRSRVA